MNNQLSERKCIVNQEDLICFRWQIFDTEQELVIFKGTVDILGNTLAFQRCKSTDSREKIQKLWTYKEHPGTFRTGGQTF